MNKAEHQHDMASKLTEIELGLAVRGWTLPAAWTAKDVLEGCDRLQNALARCEAGWFAADKLADKFEAKNAEIAELQSKLEAIRLKCEHEIALDQRSPPFAEGRMDFADVIWRMIVQEPK